MATAVRHKFEPLLESIEVTDSVIKVALRDGRRVSVPLRWSYRLELATPTERANYQVSASGRFVHWPDLDEDLSAQGFLTGTPAPRGTVAHRRFVRERRAHARQQKVTRAPRRSSKRV